MLEYIIIIIIIIIYKLIIDTGIKKYLVKTKSPHIKPLVLYNNIYFNFRDIMTELFFIFFFRHVKFQSINCFKLLLCQSSAYTTKKFLITLIFYYFFLIEQELK